MRLILTTEEFLAAWLLRRGLEPLRTDCRIMREDGIDLPRLERTAMEAWFSRQLREAPAWMLALVDVSAQARLSLLPDGIGRVTLPPGTVRVLSVEMSGWSRPALVVADTGHPRYAAQHNPFSRGGTNNPVAVQTAEDTLLLYTPAKDGAITRLEAICETTDGIYTFDSSLLDTIPKPEFLP